jgi:hypothetical protein
MDKHKTTCLPLLHIAGASIGSETPHSITGGFFVNAMHPFHSKRPIKLLGSASDEWNSNALLVGDRGDAWYIRSSSS